MCTAISYERGGRLFGRNLDVDRPYGESVIITPKDYTLSFRKRESIVHHYSFIGAGIESRGYPLYFDGVNEHGLCIAGLNFVKNARYFPADDSKINVTPFELIPYVLARFKCVGEAIGELGNINLVDIPFSRELPLAELHWLIADKKEAIVLEQTREGLRIYESRVGILTNNPPYPFHIENLRTYMSLSPHTPINNFAPSIEISPYSNGLGAFGLPGDLSSTSRFIRASFHAQNSIKYSEKAGDVYQLFHILSSVAQIEGSVYTSKGYERTEYSSVIDPESATYYYRAYTSSETHAVRLTEDDAESSSLRTYPMIKSHNVTYQN